MSFNPDPIKQAQNVIFFRKTLKTNHPLLFFNGNLVFKANVQKHVGMLLDTKFSFVDHLKTVDYI